MNILIIGGMHGNEPLGLAVVKQFLRKPVNGVDVLLANEQAIARSKRFVVVDMNRSFPGDVESSSYELKRAAEIVQICKDYDLVLDFHNTHSSGNDCGFVGQAAHDTLVDAAWLLGIGRIIVADYDCLNKYAPNCLSIEVSLSSELNLVDLWYEKIRLLSLLTDFEADSQPELYSFVYRLTLEDKQRLNLQNKELKAFEAIEPRLAKKLGVKNPAYPIFIGDGYTPYNYGGLLNKIDKLR